MVNIVSNGSGGSNDCCGSGISNGCNCFTGYSSSDNSSGSNCTSGSNGFNGFSGSGVELSFNLNFNN